jgi:diguanylate cyclase (GGDEF)-like protein/PAS domain S-box-containing protein
LSQAVTNVLYIGHNIQLVKTLLNLSVSGSEPFEYYVHHLITTNDIEDVLAEKQYTHLICELPLSKYLADKIAIDFPLLQTTYLALQDAPQAATLPEVMEGLVSDEVKATLDHLSIPVYFKDRNGKFLACNSYFSHLFGLTPAQVVGKTAIDVLYPYLVDEIEELDKKVFTEQQVCFYECKIQDLSGSVRDMVFRKESVDNGKIQIGMLFDVTDMNEAKLLLEKEHLMLRATTDLSTDLIFFKDLQSRFIGCNKQFEKFVGCSEQEILGKKDDQLFELKQALMCQEQDQEVMAKNQVYSGEEYLTYNNGERHFIDMKKVPLLDKQGQVQGLIGVGRDITEHHRLEKRLKIADTVFENSKENFIVTDKRGNIISANKATCVLLGYSKSELLDANIKEFTSHQYENIEAALQENIPWQGEIICTKKSGEFYFAWLEVYLVKHADEGIVNRIYSLTDLNQTENVDKKIQHLAKYDPLTGLFNRIALFTRLEDAITRASYKQTGLAVMLVDINDFKAINEQFGHNAGDDVLKEIAQRLKSCVFEKETVARFGDDEFVIIVDELASEQDAAIVAKKIAEQFSKTFTIKDSGVNLSATIGISLYPDDGADVDALIGNAEQAMLRGKVSNCNDGDGETLQGSLEKTMRSKEPCYCTPYHFYTGILTHHSRQQVKLEEELQQALQQDQFELYYQPQYDLNKLQPVAVEAVLCWNHPQRGTLYPDSFLSLAENNGLLVDIGLQMLRKAAMQAVTWQNSGINFGRIAIKLSLAQLSKSNFIAELQTILLETKCSRRWLEFEIDEVVFETVCPTVRGNLLNIKKLGIALTINNFGEERAVYQLLEQLGIEKLKMAKLYIEETYSHSVSNAIREAMLALTRSLGIDVVADSLGSMRKEAYSTSDAAKGWLQNKAMKASEATFYLRCHKRK